MQICNNKNASIYTIEVTIILFVGVFVLFLHLVLFFSVLSLCLLQRFGVLSSLSLPYSSLVLPSSLPCSSLVSPLSFPCSSLPTTPLSPSPPQGVQEDVS